MICFNRLLEALLQTKNKSIIFHCFKKSTYIKTGIIAVLFLIVMIPIFDFSLNLVCIAFIAGNILFVGLVYNILKNGKASDKKLDDEKWYEDKLTQ